MHRLIQMTASQLNIIYHIVGKYGGTLIWRIGKCTSVLVDFNLNASCMQTQVIGGIKFGDHAKPPN